LSRIFISYTHAQPDTDLAVGLAEHLRAGGHSAFIDTGIGVGERFADTIDRELKAADVFIVLLSQQSIRSEWVQREVVDAHELQAKSGRPKILPVRVNFDGALPLDLRVPLAPIQAARWNSNTPVAEIAAGLLSAIRSPAAMASPQSERSSAEDNRQLYAITEAVGAPLPAQDPRFVAMLETGSLEPDSSFYIRRDADAVAEACLRQAIPTTIVKAPRQWGKSSLLVRMHTQARSMGLRSWYRDFQYVDAKWFADLDTVFRFLAREMTRAFNMSQRPEDYWDADEGPMGNLTNYLENVVLADGGAPVQIVLDEVERVFEFPYRDEFFAIFRGWHNKHSYDRKYKSLTVVLGHATTPTLWIENPYQSPFNVGHNIRLQGFSPAQILDLGRRHGLVLAQPDVSKLLELLGGHPYLTRVALYTLAVGQQAIDAMLRGCVDESGPFADHLRALAMTLNRAPELRQGLRDIMRGKGCPEEEQFHRLWAAGLIRGESRAEAKPSCGIYEQYFRKHL